MSAVESLCHLVGIGKKELSEQERLLLGAELFAYLCKELEQMLSQSIEYQGLFTSLINYNEDQYMNFKLAKYLISDILKTNYYNLSGLSIYIGAPIDVLEEIYIGKNNMPSAGLVVRLIEVHRSLHVDLYKRIINKMILKSEIK